MKNLIILFFLVTANILFSQNGKIYPKNDTIIAGETNTFIYEPPSDVIIPVKSYVTVVHHYLKNTVPLVKKNNKYQFSLEITNAMNVIVMAVFDRDKKLIDNNQKRGYVINIVYETDNEKAIAIIDYLDNLNALMYFLQLEPQYEERIKKYEEAYNLNPDLKTGTSYIGYLYAKNKLNSYKAEPEIVEHINYLRTQDDEESLIRAMQLNNIIGRVDEGNKIRQLIVLKYPKGITAKNRFISTFRASKGKTEDSILASLQKYKTKFNDSISLEADAFYLALLKLKLEERDTLVLGKYEDKVKEKIYIPIYYNDYAWKLSSGDLISAGEDLNFAKYLSKKALDITKEAMEHPEEHGGYDVKDNYNNYADTYALILYKLKEYNLAFSYQDEVRKQNGLDKGGKERYAAISEKAKGLKFTKDYIEEQLSDGVDSKIMMNQLEEIYQELNLSDKKFNNLKETSVKLATEKSQKEIVDMYGQLNATDFDLVNLEGETVKLSDYKGKIVVLDFWATWCGPCRAAFPNMQKLVKKYANDPVDFFFINAFERGEKEDIKKKVAKLIVDDNYTFNVLFDFDNKVAENYKVKLIPMKIVINKKGEIISVNSSEDNLDALIQEKIR